MQLPVAECRNVHFVSSEVLKEFGGFRDRDVFVDKGFSFFCSFMGQGSVIPEYILLV